MPTLILASASPYRRQLLERLGIAFEIRAADVDESAIPGEAAETLAARLASKKADSIWDNKEVSEQIIIGSDQVAALNGCLLRKPGNHAAALQQLLDCQGQAVTFSTATSVVDCRSGRRWQGIDRTQVEFLQLPTARLSEYLDREQPYDCAGGFKAEGLGISLFSSIQSADPTSLLGLPLIWLTQVLRELGLDPLDSSRR